MFNWHKFPDNKPIAFKNYFVTVALGREIIEAYYDSNKNALVLSAQLRNKS